MVDSAQVGLDRDETRAFLREIGLVPRTTPIESPQSHGIAEAFVKTVRRLASRERSRGRFKRTNPCAVFQQQQQIGRSLAAWLIDLLHFSRFAWAGSALRDNLTSALTRTYAPAVQVPWQPRGFMDLTAGEIRTADAGAAITPIGTITERSPEIEQQLPALFGGTGAWISSLKRRKSDDDFSSLEPILVVAAAHVHGELRKLVIDAAEEARAIGANRDFTDAGKRNALAKMAQTKRERLADYRACLGRLEKRRGELTKKLRHHIGAGDPSVTDFAYAQLLWQHLPIKDSTALSEVYERAVRAGDWNVVKALEMIPRSVFPTGGVPPEVREATMSERLVELANSANEEIAKEGRELALATEASSDLARMLAAAENFLGNVCGRPDVIQLGDGRRVEGGEVRDPGPPEGA
jgi:hypothetical protein